MNNIVELLACPIKGLSEANHYLHNLIDIYTLTYPLAYVFGIITYIILLALKKMGKLKKYDKYLWSPLVVSFAGVCLFVATCILIYEQDFMMDSILRLLVIIMLFFILIPVQILWISLFFQILALRYNKKIFLNIAIAFVWIVFLLQIMIINHNSSTF